MDLYILFLKVMTKQHIIFMVAYTWAAFAIGYMIGWYKFKKRVLKSMEATAKSELVPWFKELARLN